MPLFTAFISQLIFVLQDKGSAFISQLIEDPKHWSASGNRAHDLPTGLNLPRLKNISGKEKNISVVKVSCKSVHSSTQAKITLSIKYPVFIYLICWF